MPPPPQRPQGLRGCPKPGQLSITFQVMFTRRAEAGSFRPRTIKSAFIGPRRKARDRMGAAGGPPGARFAEPVLRASSKGSLGRKARVAGLLRQPRRRLPGHQRPAQGPLGRGRSSKARPRRAGGNGRGGSVLVLNPPEEALRREAEDVLRKDRTGITRDRTALRRTGLRGTPPARAAHSMMRCASSTSPNPAPNEGMLSGTTARRSGGGASEGYGPRRAASRAPGGPPSDPLPVTRLARGPSENARSSRRGPVDPAACPGPSKAQPRRGLQDGAFGARLTSTWRKLC